MTIGKKQGISGNDFSVLLMIATIRQNKKDSSFAVLKALVTAAPKYPSTF